MPNFVRPFELKLKVFAYLKFNAGGAAEKCQQTYHYFIIYKPDDLILHVV